MRTRDEAEYELQSLRAGHVHMLAALEREPENENLQMLTARNNRWIAAMEEELEAV